MKLTTAWYLVFSIFVVVVGATLSRGEGVLGGLLVIAGSCTIGLTLRLLIDERRAAQRRRHDEQRTARTP